LKLITFSIHDHLKATELLVQHGIRVDIYVNIKMKQGSYSFVPQPSKGKIAIFRLFIDYRANLANHRQRWLDSVEAPHRGRWAATSETAKAVGQQGQPRFTPLYVRQAKHLDKGRLRLVLMCRRQTVHAEYCGSRDKWQTRSRSMRKDNLKATSKFNTREPPLTNAQIARLALGVNQCILNDTTMDMK
jgi:hypothetical protein